MSLVARQESALAQARPGEVRRVFIPYEPREVFLPFHNRTQRWAVLVCHRRSGKTTSLLADTVIRALRGPKDGRYGYIAPLYSQAKSIAWDILLGLTREVALKTYESELRVDLLNGARVRLFGGDNPDSLRGLRFDGAAMDEQADNKPALFTEVVRPALADRGGWGVFAGTPKGVGDFFDLFHDAQDAPDWFTAYLPVSVTGLLSKAELQDARRLMSAEVYAQEFECSWEAPRSGSYYGQLIQETEQDGRIGHFPHDPEQEVHVALDIGWRDSTAAWYWQPRPGGFTFIDHDEGAGRLVEEWVELFRAKGYRFAKFWLPHDARAKNMQTGRSTVEQFLAAGLPCEITPELRVQQGIDAARLILPRCYFHKPTTEFGLRRLREYHRQWNERNHAYANNPAPNQNDHTADAFRYAALVAKEHQGTPLVLPTTSVTRPSDRAFQLEVLWQDRERNQPAGAHAFD